MKYFSDRNNTNTDTVPNTSEFISPEVWNAICVLIERLISNNNLAKDFPERCPDGNCICGTKDGSFYSSLLVTIPNLKHLINSSYDIRISNSVFDNPWAEESERFEQLITFTYSVLDAIEYVCKHIYDVKASKYHESYRHFELEFLNSTTAKLSFIDSVNELFERNHINYHVSEEGICTRLVVNSIVSGIDDATLSDIEDIALRDLLSLAISKFSSPKLSERKVGLEKLWDAFERIKTILNPDNKKASANRLLEYASLGSDSFKEILEKECKELTNIGNSFQIRHYETSTNPISDIHHIDYLFYRLFTLLTLLIRYI